MILTSQIFTSQFQQFMLHCIARLTQISGEGSATVFIPARMKQSLGYSFLIFLLQV